MHQQLTTAPFGRRTLTLAHLSAQVTARERPHDKVVHKWRMFRDLCAAKQRAGVSDRALAVLNALLSFHQETALTGGDLVVFPSNRQLTLRANGMAAATLRRHIAALVDRGLVIRRDSPNGKRYARKGGGGEVEQAFGFDLSPLVARADEIEAWAEEARAEDRARRLSRERITLHRRDIAKMIETALEEGVASPTPDGWTGVLTRFSAISVRVPKVATSDELAPFVEALAAMLDQIRKVLEARAIQVNMSANESQTERHLQNSNPDDISERKDFREEKAVPSEAAPREVGRVSARTLFPLSMVLEACPDVAHYAKGGVRSWHDLMATAGLVRSVLGISPSAWQEAQEALGPESASVTISCILQRAEAIGSPGGYLRALVGRAREGRFGTGPMLLALLRTRAKEARRTG